MDVAPSTLEPTPSIDSDHPEVRRFARETIGDAADDVERAVRLYYAVRDRIRYNPYQWVTTLGTADGLKASTTLSGTGAFCVPKAILLAAAARALGIPSRLGFADVRNHLANKRLLEYLGTDLFVFHGYTELFLEGRWVKATPAFDAVLCEKFGVAPLEFDGRHDSVFQPFDGKGRQHMEYVRDRGHRDDVPLREMIEAWTEHYPRVIEQLGSDLVAAAVADFEAEAAAERSGD
jgi:transglutaminase-like putative cysteine protease